MSGLGPLLELELLPLTNARRRETLGGREYVVADAVILKVQVLNGSDGPLFYPLAEINQDIGVWNGYPLTAKHPQIVLPDGSVVSVSARIPKVAHAYQIGTVYNDRMVGEERLVEVWFDVENSNRIDKRIIPAVLSGKQINVSTGIFTGKVPEAAVHNGVSYTHRVRGIRPDHLAVLMDEKGACSTSDGCGINVHNQDTTMKCIIGASGICVNCGGPGSGVPGPCPMGGEKGRKKGTYGALKVGDTIKFAGGDRKVLEVKPHKDAPDKYTVVTIEYAGKAKVIGSFPHDKPLNNSGAQMDKATTISWLVTNCECWKGETAKETLNVLDDAVLTAIKTDAEKAIANASSLSFTVNALKEIKEVVKAPADAKISDVVALVKTNAEKAVTPPTPPAPPVPPTPGVITNEQIIAAVKSMTEKEVLALFPTLNKTIQTAQGVIDDKRFAIMNQLTSHIKDENEKKQKLLKLKDKPIEVLNEYLEFQVANATPTQPAPADANEAFLRQFFASTSPPATNTGNPIVPVTVPNGTPGGAVTPITGNTATPLASSVDYDFLNND